jgi:histidine phosphotransferase ChpT
MINSTLIISQLISTKLCHDIAGLVGAINNSLEYLNSSDESIKLQAKDLLENSSKETVKRLNFYRETYGTIRNENTNIEFLKATIESFIDTSKVSLFLENETNFNEISQLSFKFCLSLANLAYISLPRGGEMTFKFKSTEINKISYLKSLTFTGNMLRLRSETNDLLKGKTNDVNSSNINIYYIFLLLKELNQEIEITHEHDKICLEII